MFYVAHPSAAGKLCSSFMPLLTSFYFFVPGTGRTAGVISGEALLDWVKQVKTQLTLPWWLSALWCIHTVSDNRIIRDGSWCRN